MNKSMNIGFIYCFSIYKDSYYLYKIGRTSFRNKGRVQPKYLSSYVSKEVISRLQKARSQTYCYDDMEFTLELSKKVFDHAKKEKMIHSYLKERNEWYNKEFFKTDISYIYNLFQLMDGEWDYINSSLQLCSPVFNQNETTLKRAFEKTDKPKVDLSPILSVYANKTMKFEDIIHEINELTINDTDLKNKLEMFYNKIDKAEVSLINEVPKLNEKLKSNFKGRLYRLMKKTSHKDLKSELYELGNYGYFLLNIPSVAYSEEKKIHYEVKGQFKYLIPSDLNLQIIKDDCESTIIKDCKENRIINIMNRIKKINIKTGGSRQKNEIIKNYILEEFNHSIYDNRILINVIHKIEEVEKAYTRKEDEFLL